MFITRLLATFLVTLLSLFLLETGAAFAHEGHNDAFSGDSATVNMTKKLFVEPEGQKAIGLETMVAANGSLSNVISATGKVQAAENRAYDVNPQVSGIVTRVDAKQGDTVTSGQVLATIHSVEVGNLLSKLLQDKNELLSQIAKTKTQYQSQISIQEKDVELARTTFQRQQDLFKEGITAQKDFLSAKNAFESSQVKLATSRKQMAQDVALINKQLAVTVDTVKSQLKIMGLSGQEVDTAIDRGEVIADVPIRAPVAGIVTFRDVTPGENLAPTKKIFSIVDLQPIWVLIDVFQEQLPLIHLGQTVSLKTPSNHVMSGKLSSIGTVVDPNERTLHVRIVSDNKSGELKPGMFVSAEIFVTHTAQDKVVIPISGLIEDRGKQFAYVQYGNYFQPVIVKTGERSATMVEILNGLFPGDRVVVRGANQLHAQALLASNAPHSDAAPQTSGTMGLSNQALIGIIVGFAAVALVAFVAGFSLAKRAPGGEK